MKKLFGLGLALLCLTACSSDDDNASAINLDNLTKKWYNISYTVAGQTVPYDGNPAAACGKDFTQFEANGVLRKSDITDCQNDAVVTTGTYAYANEDGTTTLSTAIGGTTTAYKVIKLNADELQLERVNSNPLTIEVYKSTP